MSLGICSIFGIIEAHFIMIIIPFLIIGFGFDNIFMFLNTYNFINPSFEVYFFMIVIKKIFNFLDC